MPTIDPVLWGQIINFIQGSCHTNKEPVILKRYPLSRIYLCLVYSNPVKHRPRSNLLTCIVNYRQSAVRECVERLGRFSYTDNGQLIFFQLCFINTYFAGQCVRICSTL